MSMPRDYPRAWLYSAIPLLLVGLAGCGSGTPTALHKAKKASPATVASTTTSQTTSSTVSTTATTSPEPDIDRHPSFIASLSAEGGDEVTTKGWFGTAVPASASNVDQAALSECPEPANDGHAMVVELDLVTTITSSLSGKVTLFAAAVNGYGYPAVDFVMGFSEGASCRDTIEGGGASVNLGTLQPHQPHDFTVWVVLPNAITPNDPHPTEQQLGKENWVMAPLKISLNGSTPILQGGEGIEGPRVVSCTEGPSGGLEEDYVAVVGYTPKSISGSCPPITGETYS